MGTKLLWSQKILLRSQNLPLQSQIWVCLHLYTQLESCLERSIPNLCCSSWKHQAKWWERVGLTLKSRLHQEKGLWTRGCFRLKRATIVSMALQVSQVTQVTARTSVFYSQNMVTMATWGHSRSLQVIQVTPGHPRSPQVIPGHLRLSQVTSGLSRLHNKKNNIITYSLLKCLQPSRRGNLVILCNHNLYIELLLNLKQLWNIHRIYLLNATSGNWTSDSLWL